jgi:hypothetical protein
MSDLLLLDGGQLDVESIWLCKADRLAECWIYLLLTYQSHVSHPLHRCVHALCVLIACWISIMNVAAWLLDSLSV